MSATFARDYDPIEVGAACFVAFCLQVGVGIFFYFKSDGSILTRVEAQGATEIAVPVKMTPVLDLDGPMLKLGGKKPKLPDMWQAAPPPALRPKPREETVASTKAAETPEAATTNKPVAKPDETAAPETSATPESTALPDPSASPTSTSTADPSDKPPGDKDEGDPNGAKDGTETDPLKVNAARMYQSRLTSFFNRYISGKCAGAEGAAAGATISVSGLTVTSVVVGSSGNATFDSQVAPALQGAKGASVPPPPENYPEFLKPTFSVSVRCQ